MRAIRGRPGEDEQADADRHARSTGACSRHPAAAPPEHTGLSARALVRPPPSAASATFQAGQLGAAERIPDHVGEPGGPGCFRGRVRFCEHLPLPKRRCDRRRASHRRHVSHARPGRLGPGTTAHAGATADPVLHRRRAPVNLPGRGDIVPWSTRPARGTRPRDSRKALNSARKAAHSPHFVNHDGAIPPVRPRTASSPSRHWPGTHFPDRGPSTRGTPFGRQ